MLTGCESCGAYLSVDGRTHCGACAQDEIDAKDARIAALEAENAKLRALVPSAEDVDAMRRAVASRTREYDDHEPGWSARLREMIARVDAGHEGGGK